MKFDDSKSANSLKDRKLRGELKEYVPITSRAKRFPLKKGKSISLILGCGIAPRKSQGSTLADMQGDLN